MQKDRRSMATFQRAGLQQQIAASYPSSSEVVEARQLPSAAAGDPPAIQQSYPLRHHVSEGLLVDYTAPAPAGQGDRPSTCRPGSPGHRHACALSSGASGAAAQRRSSRLSAAACPVGGSPKLAHVTSQGRGRCAAGSRDPAAGGRGASGAGAARVGPWEGPAERAGSPAAAPAAGPHCEGAPGSPPEAGPPRSPPDPRTPGPQPGSPPAAAEPPTAAPRSAAGSTRPRGAKDGEAPHAPEGCTPPGSPHAADSMQPPPAPQPAASLPLPPLDRAEHAASAAGGAHTASLPAARLSRTESLARLREEAAARAVPAAPARLDYVPQRSHAVWRRAREAAEADPGRPGSGHGANAGGSAPAQTAPGVQPSPRLPAPEARHEAAAVSPCAPGATAAGAAPSCPAGRLAAPAPAAAPLAPALSAPASYYDALPRWDSAGSIEQHGLQPPHRHAHEGAARHQRPALPDAPPAAPGARSSWAAGAQAAPPRPSGGRLEPSWQEQALAARWLPPGQPAGAGQEAAAAAPAYPQPAASPKQPPPSPRASSSWKQEAAGDKLWLYPLAKHNSLRALGRGAAPGSPSGAPDRSLLPRLQQPVQSLSAHTKSADDKVMRWLETLVQDLAEDMNGHRMAGARPAPYNAEARAAAFTAAAPALLPHHARQPGCVAERAPVPDMTPCRRTGADEVPPGAGHRPLPPHLDVRAPAPGAPRDAAQAWASAQGLGPSQQPDAAPGYRFSAGGGARTPEAPRPPAARTLPGETAGEGAAPRASLPAGASISDNGGAEAVPSPGPTTAQAAPALLHQFSRGRVVVHVPHSNVRVIAPGDAGWPAGPSAEGLARQSPRPPADARLSGADMGPGPAAEAGTPERLNPTAPSATGDAVLDEIRERLQKRHSVQGIASNPYQRPVVMVQSAAGLGDGVSSHSLRALHQSVSAVVRRHTALEQPRQRGRTPAREQGQDASRANGNEEEAH